MWDPDLADADNMVPERQFFADLQRFPYAARIRHSL